MKKYRMILFAVFTSLGFVACSEDDSVDELNEGTAQVSVELTDAPGDYEKVLVEIVDVRVKIDTEAEIEGEDEEGWVSLGDIQTGVYDLLTLTGGTTALLADSELPAGHLSQMRLVLGGENSVVVDGVSYMLNVPSGAESGLKLQVDQELEGGMAYNFLLDFDVEESIVKAGESGNYNLKPVIRVASVEETGSIIGLVHPTTQQTLVVATNGTTTVSAYTDAEGNFKLSGVPGGTYLVTVTPDPSSGLEARTISDVSVEAGSSTDLEEIFLTETEAETEVNVETEVGIEVQ